MADVGKLISLGNLLARKTTWLVHTTTSATLILSRVFGAYCMTKIVYKYSHLLTLIVFPLWLPERTLSLSPFRLTESTHSFSFLHLTSRSQLPRKCILSATILFLVMVFRWDFFQSQPQKFRQTTERNKQLKFLVNTHRTLLLNSPFFVVFLLVTHTYTEEYLTNSIRTPVMFGNISLNVLLIYKFEFVCTALFYMFYLYASFHTSLLRLPFPNINQT